MLGWRALLTTLKHALPITRLVALAASAPPASATTWLPSPERIVELARLSCRPHLLGSRDNCLDRSLLAYRYLLAAGANPSLVIGVGRPEDAVLGHAWLIMDEQRIGEPHGAPQGFAEILRFAGDGSIHRVGRNSARQAR